MLADFKSLGVQVWNHSWSGNAWPSWNWLKVGKMGRSSLPTWNFANSCRARYGSLRWLSLESALFPCWKSRRQITCALNPKLVQYSIRREQGFKRLHEQLCALPQPGSGSMGNEIRFGADLDLGESGDISLVLLHDPSVCLFPKSGHGFDRGGLVHVIRHSEVY